MSDDITGRYGTVEIQGQFKKYGKVVSVIGKYALFSRGGKFRDRWYPIEQITLHELKEDAKDAAE